MCHRKILVTAAGRTAERLSEALSRVGVGSEVLPCIRIVPVFDSLEIKRAMQEIDTYQWLVLTSQNGVDSFYVMTQKYGIELKNLHLNVAVVGPATAAKAREYGLKVRLIPRQFTGKSLIQSLREEVVKDSNFLVIQGDLASHSLVFELEKLGAKVRSVVGYKTIEEVSDVGRLKELMRKKEVRGVTLMSGSAVRAISRAIGVEGLRENLLICIGPATAKVVEEIGGGSPIVAQEQTVEGVVEAVLEVLQRTRA